MLAADWEPAPKPYAQFTLTNTDDWGRQGIPSASESPKYRCTVMDDTWSTAVVYYDWLHTDVGLDNPTELARLALNQFAEYTKVYPENFGHCWK